MQSETESDKNSGEMQPESLRVFVSSMGVYLQFANYLPVCSNLEGLGRNSISISEAASSLIEADYIGVMTRLMLQRKYFQKNDRGKSNPQFVRNLIATAEVWKPSEKLRLDSLLQKLDIIKDRSIEVSLPDGTIQTGYFENVQDIAYGALLHADSDKLIRISQLPENMQTVYVGEYVMAREGILRELYSLLCDFGITPFSQNEYGRNPSVHWVRGNSLRAITCSPKWSGLVGKDASIEELLEIAKNMTKEEGGAWLAAAVFFWELCAENPDVRALKQMVAPWTLFAWGDFTDAVDCVRHAGHVGISSNVIIRDGGHGATVKLIPDVEAPFIINEPQMILAGTIDLARLFGKWKVLRLSL